VDVRVQNIVAQTGTLDATEAVCTDPPKSAESDFVLVFLVLNGSGVSQVPMPAQWPPADTPVARYDVLGPTPPTNVTASPGGESAILSFDASTDDDLAGYNAFCSIAGTGDAGGDCSGGGLVAGEIPVPPAFGCGSAGFVTEELTVTGLMDDTQYAIGVSARDTLENNGPLSSITCVTPKATTGYYEAYRAAGGTAGGGFCSLSRRPSPFAAGAVFVALAGLVSRRRRRQ
jgi:hypothetical protein